MRKKVQKNNVPVAQKPKTVGQADDDPPPTKVPPGSGNVANSTLWMAQIGGIGDTSVNMPTEKVQQASQASPCRGCAHAYTGALCGRRPECPRRLYEG